MGKKQPEQPSSPKKESKAQFNAREEIDVYNTDEAGSQSVVYYDFDDEEDIVATSTVKKTDWKSPETSRQGTNIPIRPSSPAKPNVHSAQSRSTKSDEITMPVRSSATSSTAVSPTNPPNHYSNFPLQQYHQIKVLEDILLPSLENVTSFATFLTVTVFAVHCGQRFN
jgi:hypothetical protein